MTREDIIRMAREAGGVFIDPPCGDCYTFDIDDGTLERFAELIASDERERIKTANEPEIEKVNAELKKLSEENTKLWGWYRDAEQQLAIWQRRGKTK